MANGTKSPMSLNSPVVTVETRDNLTLKTTIPIWGRAAECL